MRSAYVLYKDQIAGTLTETAAGGSEFVYADGWTETIAVALPVSDRAHVWAAGLHPFFQHLGPEGWLRGAQAKAANLQEEDDFGLLLRYGQDCIGAVGVRPVNSSDEYQGGSAGASPPIAGGRRTVSGVQRKLLAFRDGDTYRPAAQQDDPATHIAKFNSANEPTLVRNENLTLQLARQVLGEKEVTAAAIGRVSGVEDSALIVERFDRRDGRKLRLEDFAQILSKPRGLDYTGKYQSSYEEAATVIRDHSVRPLIDLERFYRLVAFNLVVGNADAHLKNFSLLETDAGLRLSPAYDLLNTVIYGESYDQYAALEIGGSPRLISEIDRQLLLQLGADIGLPAPAAKAALDTIRKRFQSAPALCFDDLDPASFRANYTQIVHEGAARILS